MLSSMRENLRRLLLDTEVVVVPGFSWPFDCTVGCEAIEPIGKGVYLGCIEGGNK